MKFNYTIIIPHKNIPQLLQRCLDSIPERDDIQIIIVDDNSDASKVDFNHFPGIERKNVEVYFTKEGKGAGYARNVGLKHVQGKWVLFADSDDFFVEDFNNILDKYCTADADIIYFNTIGVYSEDIHKKANRNKDDLFLQYERDRNIDIFRYSYTEPWGKIIKAILIQENELEFEETKVANDYMFSVQTGCLAKQIIAINHPLYIVTLRKDSLSYRDIDTIEKLQTRIEVTARVQVYLEKHHFYFKPMPVFGLMVNLMHRNLKLFIKNLLWFSKIGISPMVLLSQIFVLRILSPNKRKKKNIYISEYETSQKNEI